MGRIGQLFFGRTTTSNLQFDSLDGLRAVAALLVVFGHMPLLNLPLLPGTLWIDYAKTGVYLFFSLSAFLLTIVLLRSTATGQPRTWARYALRRVLRIYPMYIVLLAWMWSIWLRHHIPIYGMTFPVVVQHMLLQAGQGVFWTIAVEFKFYFVLPIVIATIVVLRRRVVPVVAVLLISVACAVWIWPGDAYELNTLTLGPYLPIFLLGSLAGFLHTRVAEASGVRSRRTELGFELLALVALVAVATLNSQWWFDARGRHLERFAFASDYWLYGVLLGTFLFAHMNGTGWIRRALSWRPVRFVGLISYSLYLVHGSVVSVVRGSFDADLPGRAWIALVAMLLLSTLTYLVVERPFLRWGLRWFRPVSDSRS